MLSKALLLVNGKVAAAALGVVLVGGVGAATVAAAAGANVPVLSGIIGHSTTKDTGSDASSHAHSISVEGVLTGYNAGGNTISVIEHGDKSATTIDVNSKTEVNGDRASSLKDLSKVIGHKVEAQVTKQKSGALLAWKVTVEAATGDQGQGQQVELQGTVTSIGSSSFVIKLADGSSKTVTVSSATHYSGRGNSPSHLKVGDTVNVHGTVQSNGSVAADTVEQH
ncbi:MAG: hypothetical protein C5B60_00435 [Chloroflexi bacterium]|nr:MAG: hypothetical protein C5B60_00435 [Chloroflexota bacterium]